MSAIIDLQSEFLKNIGLLIGYVNTQPGWQMTEGEGERPAWVAAEYAKQGKGSKNSLHIDRLAHDFNFYYHGAYITDMAMLAPFADYWKSLNPANCWGGDFTGTTSGDVFHFSMGYQGRK